MCRREDRDCTLLISVRFSPFVQERRFRLSSDISLRGENGGQPVMLGMQREQFEHDESFHLAVNRWDCGFGPRLWVNARRDGSGITGESPRR